MSHLYGKRSSFRGVFAVERGRGVLARLLGGLMRLPLAGDSVVVELDVVPEGNGERWIRRFDSRKLETYVCDHGSGRWSERFGPLEFWFRIETIGGAGIRHRQERCRFGFGSLTIPLPRFVAPRVDSVETPGSKPRAHHVRVTIDAPVVGRLLYYEGEVVQR